MKWWIGLLSLWVWGCGGETVAPEPTGDDVTWYRDVLPVAQDKCLGCHNDEAPTFSMQRFSDELSLRAPLIADFVTRGVMPPWKPSAECNEYRDERRLSDEEMAIFSAWVDGGALEGDPSDAPPPPEADASLEWIDRTLEMEASYLPDVGGSDPNDLHCFVLDPELTEDVLLVGFDIRPGEARVVHHVLLYVADSAEADAKDASDPAQGYSCFGGPGAASAKVIAGWVPGMPPNAYPTGTGVPLPVGSRLIMQIHYNGAQAGPLPDRTQVDLQLARTVLPNEAQIVSIANSDFAIPPHTDGFASEKRLSVPANGTILAAAPHMHVLGRRAQITIERADGSSECLVDIPDWDFDWQQFYFLAEGADVGPGDEVSLTCTWDNVLDSTVTWGEGTEDEMCVAYFYVTAR